MWRLSAEVPRIKALREAASLAMKDIPLAHAYVHLGLRLYAEPRDGDLDNFLTGICDGLMAADPKAAWNGTEWEDVEPVMRPDCPIVYADDSLIKEIHAERLPIDADGRRYEVVLEFE